VTDASAPTGFAKDFLSILDLSHVDLERLLRVSVQMKADRRLRRQAPSASVLAGLHVALLFEKPSLRTWSTFEIAVRELGGDTLHLDNTNPDNTNPDLPPLPANQEITLWIGDLVGAISQVGASRLTTYMG